MRYADPHACPACRGRIDREPRCPRCGFVLRGELAARLWSRLQDADRLVSEARAASQTPPPQQSPPPPPPRMAPPLMSPPSPPPTVPPRGPQPAPAAAPRGSGVNAGSIILALGALLLLVAATIFITVSWDRLGLLGRSLVLFAATALGALAAAEVTRRRLRGSAEALWAVTLGLITLDWFAARERGLAGLSAVPRELHVGAWSVVLSAVALAVVTGARRRLGRSLVVPQVAAAVTPWLAVPAVLAYLWGDEGWPAFWSGAVATLTAVAVVLMAWRARAPGALWGGAAPVILMAPFLLVTAITETLAHPTPHELLVEGRSVPLLLLSVLAALAAFLLPRWGEIPAAGAIFGPILVLATGVAGAATVDAGLATAAVAAAAVAVVPRGAGTWARGARWCAVVLAVWGTALIGTGWLDTLAVEGTDPWRAPVSMGLDLGALAYGAMALGVVVVLAVSARWPGDPLAGARRPLIAALIVFALQVGLAAEAVPFGWVVLAGIAAAAGALAWLARAHLAARLGMLAVLVCSAQLAFAAPELTSVAFALVALVAVVLAASGDDARVSAPAAAVTVIAVVTAGLGFAEWQRIDSEIVALFLVLVAIVTAAVASWGAETPVLRVTLEITAALVGLGGLLAGVGGGDATWLALLLLLAALALFGMAFDLDDRRWCHVPAIALSAAAWISLMVGQDVRAVEAVTVPLAAIALGVGAWFMRRDERTRTLPALGVGLALGFLPSLPQALADPTSVRAGVLGAAAVAAIGLGWWRSWQAPFVAGSVVLALLVVVNLWPVAMAVQRWILFGALGLVLLAIGVTWESRVRQGRAVLRAIASLR